MWRVLTGLLLFGMSGVTMVAFGASLTERVTVCDVPTDPAKYNGKMILLVGEIYGTGEGGWLTASSCPIRFKTGGHVWPNSIFLQEAADPRNLHKVDFATLRRIGSAISYG